MDQLFNLHCFTDEELDGDAIVLGLASDPGPSWLKDIIPKMGVRLKVHSVLRSLYLSQVLHGLSF